MIILGDAGINYGGGTRDRRKKEFFESLPITIFAIHGNHEQRPQSIEGYAEKVWRGGVVYWEEEYPSLLFAKDGEVFELDGKQTIVMGGAYSIDKMVRLMYGDGWWPDEQKRRTGFHCGEGDISDRRYQRRHTAGLKSFGEIQHCRNGVFEGLQTNFIFSAGGSNIYGRIKRMEALETEPAKLSGEELGQLLNLFGISSYFSFREIDSSHEEADLRWNYIIDKKYVLRVNSCSVMTEDRLREINALAGRYIEAGIQCPKYIASGSGAFVVRRGAMYCYLSEYLDYELASEKELCDKDKLDEEIRDFTAAFAQRYRNIGLSEIMSMYSLFELCPYDREAGIDEKQENLCELVKSLEELGCTKLGGKLSDRNESVRKELKSFYKQLPRCVFQGDENFTNVLVDRGGHFAGLIDFNMSGTDVIVNYFANITGLYIDEEQLAEMKPEAALAASISRYRTNMKRMFVRYRADETERRAAALYAYIVLLSSWPNVCSCRYGLGQKELSEKTQKLLEQISELDIGRLYV